MKTNLLNITTFAIAIFIASCGNKKSEGTNEVDKTPDTEITNPDASTENLGIGPITENPELSEELDAAMVKNGEALFTSKTCITCHNFETKGVGPNLKNILSRRSAAWVMNMMLDPNGMLENDEDAKALLAEYNGVKMIDNKLTKAEARSVVEFIRSK